MLYCTRADLDLIFGKSNILQWADANNNQIPAEIDDRCDWAIESATDEIDSFLAETHYPFPLADTVTVPKLVKRITTMLAGVMLYNLPRGTADVDSEGNAINQLTDTSTYVYATLNRIIARQIKITGLDTATTVVPFVVTEDDPYPTSAQPSQQGQLPPFNPLLPIQQ